MIDKERRVIYIDNSTLAAHRACHEKANLSYNIGWRSNRIGAAPGFGHAIHSGIAGYYDAKAGGYHKDGTWHLFEPGMETDPVKRAQLAFLEDIRQTGMEMPLRVDDIDVKHSIERGLALLDAYIYRYRNEPYDNIIIDGKPLVEVGFTYDLCNYTAPDGDIYKIVYCGFIDRIMRNRATKLPVNHEFKTTSLALSQYIKQCNPNSQITGYKPAGEKILNEPILTTVWDCMFISDRQPDLKKAEKSRFFMYGVDVEKDFKREFTTRNADEVADWWVDTVDDARNYAYWLFSDNKRWTRNTGSCNQFGGCDFRKVCIHRQSADVLATDFHIEKWNPAKRIREGKR